MLFAAAAPAPAAAWGREGHEIIAAIARTYLAPQTRITVDAMLAQDPDPLSGRGMVDAASWADDYRDQHRETSAWHYVDLELDGPDLKSACHGFPRPVGPASAGPAKDCIVNKMEEFEAELASPDTPRAERLIALKFLLHLVGDLHQPLHAADNHDHGGNCVLVSLGGARTTNLHHFWDTTTIDHLGQDAQAAAARLRKGNSPAQIRRWQQGSARDWALESYSVAQKVAYRLGTNPGCEDRAPIEISSHYAAVAQHAADLQLDKAGVRLAHVLNVALGGRKRAELAPSSHLRR
jgi:hypothetical protein